MSIEIDSNYVKFIKYIKAYIKRDGIENLIAFFEKSDIRIAPASTKYHLSCEGGLIQHSLNVFMRLIKMLQLEYGEECPYSKETIAIVGLLHDISKVGFYAKKFRNVKNEETGQWESVPYYSVKEDDARLLFSTHEENSLYVLSKFLKLTYEEELAIRYHMGVSTDSESQNRVYTAFNLSPLAALLHTADLLAMTVDESELTLPTKFAWDIEKDAEDTTEGEPVNEQNVERPVIDTSSAPF